MPDSLDPPPKKLSFPTSLLLAAAIISLAALIEFAMGRAPMCKCGYITFWVGDIHSPELSQQIADWYSFSHIIHGFALYAFALLILGRRSSTAIRFLLTVILECGWEVLENSPLIINRYRQTMAQGYLGDSIVNSMSDILFCLIGFALASYLRPWIVIALIVLMELGVGYIIHDNLALNIIMLIHPFAAIKRWQMGVP